MRALAPSFEQESRANGRTVRVEFEPASFEDAKERANQDFRAQTGRYDIVLQYNFSLAEYAGRNYVLRPKEIRPLVPAGLFEEVEASLFPRVWREVGFYYTRNGEFDGAAEAVGYPFAANTMVLAFNRRLFDDRSAREGFLRRYRRELSPPERWEHLKEVAAFFTDRSKNRCGIALQGKDEGWLYYEWMNFLHGFGGTVMQKEYGWQSGPGRAVELDTPVAVQAAEFYKSLLPFSTCGDFFNTDAPAQRELLLTGRVAMAIIWSDYLWELVAEGAKRNISFGFAPVPGSKSLIGGGSYYINRRSKNADVAAQFVMFLLREANQVELAKHGLCSPVRAVYADPGVAAIPYSSALRSSLARASSMLEAGPDSEMIAAGITEALQRALRGEAVQSVLRDTQVQLARDREQLFRRMSSERRRD